LRLGCLSPPTYFSEFLLFRTDKYIYWLSLCCFGTQCIGLHFIILFFTHLLEQDALSDGLQYVFVIIMIILVQFDTFTFIFFFREYSGAEMRWKAITERLLYRADSSRGQMIRMFGGGGRHSFALVKENRIQRLDTR
jgi:hypothetical protein